jgi:DNA repair protein RecO (recombination protein O)
VSGIAKGAKRSRRRFVNVLEPFTHVQLRFRPGRADDLAFIFGCELLQSFRAPSRDLQRFALASYAVELIDVMVTGREAGQEIYTLLLDSLREVERAAEISSLFLSAFEVRLLTYVGYAPHLAGCQQCGTPLNGDETQLVFSPNLGGLLCARCRHHGGTTVVLSHDTLSFLRSIQNTGLFTLLSSQVSPRVQRETRAVATGLLARHLPRPLKSRAFLEQAQLFTDTLVDAPPGE